ncbi:MAG: hypothetical protein WCC30_01505 [Candidatus Dormiibacterota bacterium]
MKSASSGTRSWWIVMLMVVAACGSAQPQPTSVASSSPMPSTSSPPRPLLFAALETNASAAQFQWNTVAIAGLDGIARAKTTFVPMPIPYGGCEGPVLPPSAHVAAGKVYFADGMGKIRSLSPQGDVATVATIPFTGNQQMLSFAVSPDGMDLLAAVFTLPAQAQSGNPCAGGAPFEPGPFTLDVYSVQAGGASRRLYHEVLPTSSTQPLPNVMAFSGWDKIGPEATYPTQWATQGGGPHPDGVTVWVDPSSGQVSRQLSDPQSCLVWDVAASGDFVCTTPQAGDISVRRPDGTEVWSFKAPANSPYENPRLSPLEGRVAAGGRDSAVVTSTGNHVALGLYPLGWLDDTTVIGGGYTADFTYVSLSTPSAVTDIGFKGLFVGAIEG